jgi:hypothetical protein
MLEMKLKLLFSKNDIQKLLNKIIFFRPGDGLPSTRSVMQNVFYGTK